MNPRRVIDFFSSRSGKLLIFIFSVFVGLGIIRGCKRNQPDADNTKQSQQNETSLQESSHRGISPLPPSPVAPAVSTNLSATSAPPALIIYADLTSEFDLSPNYLPYGSLIPALTIGTIASDDDETPIIALVTEDVYHLGEVIIPENSLIHGRMRRGRIRDRIYSGETSWVLVWPTGEELTVSGIALEQERFPSGGYGTNDARAGLAGKLEKSGHWEELKMLLATFLSGAAQTLEERQVTAFGSQVLPNVKTIGLQGASEVLNRYAAQILERLEKEGYHVVVPGGKPLYLYVTQTLDRGKARVGSSRPKEENRALAQTTPRKLP